MDKQTNNGDAAAQKPPLTKGLVHLVRSTGYSIKGLRTACKEAAFRQEILLGVVTLPLAFWLGHSALAKVLVCMGWLIVLIAELLNTAIEAIVNLASPGFHKLAGQAKDLGSASVTIALLLYGATWVFLIVEICH